jgi:hypothetical protein
MKRNAECRVQNAELNARHEGTKDTKEIRSKGKLGFFVFPSCSSCLRGLFAFVSLATLASTSHATPKLEDVFKSTQENFGKEPEPGMFLAWLCVAAGVIVVLIFLHRRYQREATPRVVNHQGKLNRALQKQIGLKSSEVRQLKTLTEGQPINNPLTLLLCPSLLAKAARERPEKFDRKLVAGMIKRMS